MKIAQLFENDIEEARRGNWGREQSHATGQQLGRDIAAGLSAADQQAAIQRGQAQATQGQAQADLQARLAQRKAQKAAAPAATAAAPAQQTQPAAEPTQQAQPDAAQAAPAGEPAQQTEPKKSIGQRIAGAVGGVSKAIGAVGGGIAGAKQQLQKGYQTGKAAVTGQGAPAKEPAQAAPRRSAPVSFASAPSGGQAAPAQAAGGTAPARSGNAISQLTSRVDALEKAVGIAEEFTFESKFLGMKI